jgi:ribosome-binding protein aMBF1 (putative translation factor)
LTLKNIFEIVKNERKKRNLTQTILSRLCKTGVKFIVDLEAGKPTCQIDKVIYVLDVLDIKIYINKNK